jgi:hypothetical protein
MDNFEIRGLRSDQFWDFENGFHWFSSPARLNKILSQFEIYNLIRDVPGDVFELGVFKGVSLIRLCNFRTAIENDFARKIVGFDAFGKFPNSNLSLSTDHDFIKVWESESGDGLSLEEVNRLIEFKGIQNISLVQGDIREIIPQYLANFPWTKIALLHLDLDVYEPTKYALEVLFPYISSGGVVMLDDYSTVEGANKAVDNFVLEKNLSVLRGKFNATPSYFIKK